MKTAYTNEKWVKARDDFSGSTNTSIETEVITAPTTETVMITGPATIRQTTAPVTTNLIPALTVRITATTKTRIEKKGARLGLEPEPEEEVAFAEEELERVPPESVRPFTLTDSSAHFL